MRKIYLIKKNGEKEVYNQSKIINSLRNAGAEEQEIKLILEKLEFTLYNNITTKEIFRFVFKELRKLQFKTSVKYNLKQGIIDMTLGGGYVFEKFVARLFEGMGYKIQLNKHFQGKFISHEIDVSAIKNSEKLMIECKHFSKPWLGTSIQTALYVYARFLDLGKTFNKPMLITNTKFSQQTIDYSKGVKLELMGWKYPLENSLEKTIEKMKIYPITILPIKKSQIKHYLQKGILTIQDLSKEKNLSPTIKKEIEELIN